MSQNSRELVKACLNFEYPERIPRDMWVSPYVINGSQESFRHLDENYPSDIQGCYSDGVFLPSPREKGNPYKKGEYTDEWGCKITNIQEGIIGEVRDPIIADIADWDTVQPPYEILPKDCAPSRDIVNAFCAGSDKFVMSRCVARPWERYQFLRKTENAMMDVLMPDMGFKNLLKKIHDYYMKEMEFWVTTDVDAINFMDDWGAQNQLLIAPEMWREYFKPLYKDYCDMAHAHGKYTFMHSDGHISAIYDDLIEVGVDAINSQLFCMDMAELAKKAKGKITFWGEIDRQHILPDPDPEKSRQAVSKVAEHLYDPSGGIIAQFELGPGAHVPNAEVIFKEWEGVGTAVT